MANTAMAHAITAAVASFAPAFLVAGAVLCVVIWQQETEVTNDRKERNE
jgi:hypothetical protein